MTNEEQRIFEEQKIVPVELVREMKSSYIDYAMSVIVSRALPDVRDGLKPVHRRILYKCTRTDLLPINHLGSQQQLSETFKYYHPHGDVGL